MFEFLMSALPSVALSLQPNTNRVKGKFIPYVLSRALPGAFTMAVGILSIYVLHRTPLSEAFALNAIVPGTDNTPVYQAIMMLALTFCGLVMLFRICQPFNLFRTVLFLTTTALCLLVVCVPYLGNIVFTGWESIVFTMDQILLLIIIVQAAFPLSGFLIRVFDLMNPAEE